MNDKYLYYYLNMVIEDLKKDMVYSALCNTLELEKMVEDKKLKFQMCVIGDEILYILDAKQSKKNYKTQINEVINDILLVIKRRNLYANN